LPHFAVEYSLDHIVTQYELESLWVKGALPSVAFPFDERVRAISGPHAGKVGRVVALLSIEPSPLYVIEEPDGYSFNTTQEHLESTDLTNRSSQPRPRAKLILVKQDDQSENKPPFGRGGSAPSR
jgi:hypothetical protein